LSRHPQSARKPEPKTRVVVAVQDPVLRADVRAALESSTDCTEVDSAGAAVDTVAKGLYDVCFIDAAPNTGGGQAVRLIQALRPGAKIVLITTKPTEEEFLRAVRIGAAGYLQDTVDRRRLPEIVAAVMRGEAAIPRILVQRLVDEVRSIGRRRIVLADDREVALTRREGEVLELIRDGLPTHAIARRLGIEKVTVRRHRASVFSKLGIGSGSDLNGLSVQPLYSRQQRADHPAHRPAVRPEGEGATPSADCGGRPWAAEARRAGSVL
jgi:DNA-binding NarL/FixJ family response regulator